MSCYNANNALFGIILYILLQILFLPVALIGLVHIIYREIIVARKLGVSFSAIQALQLRWLGHYFRIGPDPLSARFVKRFPCESHWGLTALLGALILARRLFGFVPPWGRLAAPGEATTLGSYGNTRIFIFDRIMKKYADKMEQIVIPGAGFDLRDLRLTRGKKIRVFELDQAGTQKVKLETLQKAGLEHDWITYIPVDYLAESWVDKLIAGGFDRTKKTLFFWESVSLYLKPAQVEDTLRKMADLGGEGSIIAQDFFSRALISGETSRIIGLNKRILEKMGEPWLFGIDMSRDPKAAVEVFLKECGWNLTAYIQFGDHLDIKSYYCITESEINSH